MTRILIVSLLSLFAFATGAFAQTPCSVPNMLTNGTNADATQVMANFNAILNCVNNSTSGRKVLTANTTYYVRTDGNDSNNGLSNTPSGAFLTIQKAINVALTLDLGGYSVTIQVGAGTYTGGVNLTSPFIGGNVTISGDTTTPSNVVISITGNNCIQVSNPGVVLNVQGLKLTTTTSGTGLVSLNGAQINVVGKMDFGSMGGGSSGFHMYTQHGGIAISTAYTISGGAQAHWFTADGGYLAANNLSITLTGTPAFSIAFSWSSRGGIQDVYGNTFTGSATGTRYSGDGCSVFFVNGGGASYLPGSVTGSIATGSQYY